jgi:hypothetical protein
MNTSIAIRSSSFRRADIWESNLRETAYGISQAQKEETTMSEAKFPAGWDEEKVRPVLAYYEEQTEDDALLEDEAGIEPSETVMNIPHDLVPKVRELIAKRTRK